MDVLAVIVAVYALGLLAALVVIKDPFPERLTVAAVWPLGFISFLAVITVLLLALPIAMPRVALALAGLILVASLVWIWVL